MSKTVDERVVEMRFDNSQFERGIAQSLQSLKALKDSLDFSGINDNGLNSLTKDVSNIGTNVDSIAGKFTALGVIGVTALGKISSAAIDLGQSMVQNLTKNMQEGYDKYNIMMESIQTIMYGTREQIGEGLKWATEQDQMDYVSAQIEKLNWYTDETSYNLTDMTNSIGKFVSAGVDLDDATTAMMGISSWAAISGQNAEAASRAMYNLSQALAIGKVTVADWKSIELANMATTEFKHTVADLAFEMGKLHETDEGWYAAYDDKGKEVLVGYESMRQSLSAGWFDNEVLTAVLKLYGGFADDLYDSVEKTGLTATEMLRYTKMYKKALSEGKDMTKWVIDLANDDNISNYVEFGESLAKLSSEENELGRQAFMAAQECKTFKDVMLATEDAATSAWMGIYTAIFGNYLQSKELWTALAEEMYDLMVDGVATLRNTLQGWNDLGGRDDFIDGLWNIWYNIRDVLDAFHDAFDKWLPSATSEQLANMSKSFKEWTESIRFLDFEELVPGWVSHLEKLETIANNVALGFRHISDFFSTVASSAAKAWERIFPSDAPWMVINRILNGLIDLTAGFEDFTATLFFSDAQAAKLERTFAGFFAVLDIGRMLLMTILEPFTKIKAEAVDIKDPILDVTAAIGDWLVALRDWIRDNNYFSIVIGNIVDFISGIPAKADRILQKLFNIGLDDLWEMIKSGAMMVAGAVYYLFTNLPKWANEATMLLFGTDLAGFWEMFKGWVVVAADAVRNLFIQTEDAAGNVTRSPAMNFLLDFWNKLTTFVKDTGITIWDFCTGLPGYINLAAKLLFKTDLNTWWTNFKGWIKSVGDAIVNLFSNIIPEKVNELCKYLFGSDLKGIWEDLKKRVLDTGESIKEFFTSIPERVAKMKAAFYGSKLYEFWTKFKIKVKEAWTATKDFFLNLPSYANDLSIKLFGTDIETWWTNFCDNVVNAWITTRDFFVNLPKNVNDTCQKLFKSDFPTFWENTKKNVKDTWDNIKTFFEELPDKADGVAQKLHGTDMVTWWQDIKDWCSQAKDKVVEFFEELPGRIEQAKLKFIEIKDAVVEFFTVTVPAKADEWSQKLFGKDFKGVCDDVVAGFNEVKDAVIDFFGIGEEYQDNGYMTDKDSKTEYDPNAFLNVKPPKKSGIKQIKEDIESIIADLKYIFGDWDKFMHSDVGKFLKNVGILGQIAVAIYSFYKVAKAIADLKGVFNKAGDVVEQGSNKGFWGNFVGGFINPFKDTADAATKAVKKVDKFMMIKLIADCILEIAASLWVVASINPLRLWDAVIAIAILFGAIYGAIVSLGNIKFQEGYLDKLKNIGEAFALLGFTMIEIAAAFWLMKDIDPAALIPMTIGLGALFGACMGALITLDKTHVNVDNAMAFAKAMGIMSLGVLAIGAAFWLMKDMDPVVIQAAAWALGGLLTAIVGLAIGLQYAKVAEGTLYAFGVAVAAIGAGAMMAGAGLWLVADAFEKFGSMDAGGIDNLIYGMSEFFEDLPQMATKAGEAIGAFFQSLADNADSIKAGALAMADVIMSVLEGVVPRLVDLLMGALKQIINNLKGMIPDIMDLLSVLLDELLNFLSVNTPKLIDFIILFTREVLRALVTLTPEITAAAVALLIDTLTQIRDNIAEVTALLIEIALETIVGTIDGLAREIPRIMESLWNFVISLLNAFADGIERHTAELKAAIQRVKDAISYFFVEIFGFDPFEGSDDEDDSNFLDFGAKLTRSLANGLESAKDKVEEAAKGVADAVMNKVCEIFGVDRENLNDASKNGFGAIAMCLINGLVNKFVPEDIKNKIHEWADKIIGFVCDTFGLDKDNLMNQAAEGKFFEIAGQVMAGFINGINKFGKDAIDAIGKFGEDTITGLKNILGIESPSKVTYGIGKYFDEGFANAVTDYAYLSEDAVAGMADGSIAAMAGTLSSLSDMVMDEVDTEPVIKPVLDLSDVANSSGMIDGMLYSDRSLQLTAGVSDGINANLAQQASMRSAFDDLRMSLGNIGKDDGKEPRQVNNFYISGDDPRAIADEVSRILQTKVERKGMTWA